MPTLAVVSFNIVCATLGAFIALFGLISFLFKEKFYLSETLISTIAGVIFSPHAANLIRPLEYALGSEETLNTITLDFSRLVLGIQLFIAGVQLPSKYLQLEWRSLAYLLGPGMIGMWLLSSFLIWAMVPNLTILYAMAVGACITPTDPVLANNIVKGKFADKNIPRELQRIIIAESGANDGLGYPFLFFALYLIKFVLEGGRGSHGNAGTAIGMWMYEIWVYEILLGIIYGAVVGWLAKELLHWAEKNKYVDRESFLVFAIAVALFIVGTAGMIGTDDVLACFIAGNTFTWDDWFRVETEDDSLQPTIDMLLNVAFFIWIGATAPWYEFAHNSVIPLYRLVPLGIMILLFRRPPVVLLMHKRIHQIEHIRQAMFVGFFGPIGVSALFYLYVTIDWLRKNIQYEGEERDDARRLEEILRIVIWFSVVCSVFVHGLSIPLGKLGFYIPRTLSRAISEMSETNLDFERNRPAGTDGTGTSGSPHGGTSRVPTPPRGWKIGTPIPAHLGDSASAHSPKNGTGTPEEGNVTGRNPNLETGNAFWNRSIRFPDEESGPATPPTERTAGQEKHDVSEKV
ncbi:hypothetical protein BT63DRAFT_376260 [Microthyrium microscopicum]|uniref:Cation/H+ exchanger transmembrane domain-containing protein n=1 Tax=Microthyrium microscopicum TaxID=703497 RepID=A0A6A6U694_9PEZI|nr:hypothetical protein BT63DRAFT_376260 [Microthyrium microscopicum]